MPYVYLSRLKTVEIVFYCVDSEIPLVFLIFFSLYILSIDNHFPCFIYVIIHFSLLSDIILNMNKLYVT